MDDFRKVALHAPAAIGLVVVVSSALAAPPGERRAADIVGTEVVDSAGRSLGVVRKVVIDMHDERVAYVLAAADAPLEAGERAVRVDAGDLRPAYRDDRFVLLLPPGEMSRLQTFEVSSETR